MHVSVGSIPARAYRWLARTAISAIGVSVALMILAGIQGPSGGASAVAPFPAAPPWPPWFTHSHSAPALVAAEVWLAVLLGGAGVVAGLLALRRGWRPRPRRLIIGSVVAVVSLMVMPPLGSSDMLHYAAYGRIAVLGHSPYVMTPGQLESTGDAVGAVTARYYPNGLSGYGPLATASEAAASDLAGDSAARTLFWLKVWNALAYLALVLALDRVLRSDGPGRARAHLLWSVNPLMLWAVMAGGHIDGLGAVFGAAALFAMRGADTRRGLLAGVLLGLAAAIKAPYALFGVGLAWAARRSPRSIVGLAFGGGVVLVPCYLIAGRAAISAVTGIASGAPRGFTVLYAVSRVLHWHDVTMVEAAGFVGFAMLAAILVRRMPPGPRDFPAVRAALAVTLAWLIVSPQVQPWYYAMVFPLLAVTAASRLDWVVLATAAITGVAELPPLFVGLHPEWLPAVTRTGLDVLTPIALAGTGAALVWLCLTKDWRSAQPGSGLGVPRHGSARRSRLAGSPPLV